MIRLLSLGQKLLNLTAVLGIILAALVYLLDESLFDIFFKELDVEFLVLPVEIVQKVSLVFDVSINS